MNVPTEAIAELFRLADAGHEGAREALADIECPGWDDEPAGCIHGCMGECDDPTAGFVYPDLPGGWVR